MISRKKKVRLFQRKEALPKAKAQQVFNMYCTMRLVPREQLFGGKIIAALDRQHPRDIFDTMNPQLEQKT